MVPSNNIIFETNCYLNQNNNLEEHIEIKDEEITDGVST